jgi:hypothetical protein
MSLRFDFSQIANHEELRNDEGEVVPATRDLIFSTMAIGLGKLTEKNFDKFYARLEMWTAMFMNGEDAPHPSVVRRHIGLTTNVVDESDSAWLKRMWENYQSDSQRRVSRLLKMTKTA